MLESSPRDPTGAVRGRAGRESWEQLHLAGGAQMIPQFRSTGAGQGEPGRFRAQLSSEAGTRWLDFNTGENCSYKLVKNHSKAL